MTHPLAPLLVPELRWDPGHGFTYLDELIGDALELGVGGFLITGGSPDDVVMLNLAGEVTESAVSNIAFVRGGLFKCRVSNPFGYVFSDAVGCRPFRYGAASLSVSDSFSR